MTIYAHVSRRRSARRSASWERRWANAVAVTVAVKGLACIEQTGHPRWSEVVVRGGVEPPTFRFQAHTLHGCMLLDMA